MLKGFCIFWNPIYILNIILIMRLKKRIKGANIQLLSVAQRKLIM